MVKDMCMNATENNKMKRRGKEEKKSFPEKSMFLHQYSKCIKSIVWHGCICCTYVVHNIRVHGVFI